MGRVPKGIAGGASYPPKIGRLTVFYNGRARARSGIPAAGTGVCLSSKNALFPQGPWDSG